MTLEGYQAKKTKLIQCSPPSDNVNSEVHVAAYCEPDNSCSLSVVAKNVGKMGSTKEKLRHLFKPPTESSSRTSVTSGFNPSRVMANKFPISRSKRKNVAGPSTSGGLAADSIGTPKSSCTHISIINCWDDIVVPKTEKS